MKVKLRVSRFGRIVLAAVVLVLHLPADEPIRDAICDQFDLEPCEIFLSGTHTHSGPTPTLGEDGHPNNLDYTRSLKAKLLEATGQAVKNIGPMHMGAGRGYSPVGSNRREKQADGSVRLGRNPYGPTDKEVLVMKLTKPDGTPTAALFDYASHREEFDILPGGNTMNEQCDRRRFVKATRSSSILSGKHWERRL